MTPENRQILMWGITTGIQFLTIVFIWSIPTEPVEMVCVGIYDNPNAVRCYEQD